MINIIVSGRAPQLSRSVSLLSDHVTSPRREGGGVVDDGGGEGGGGVGDAPAVEKYQTGIRVHPTSPQPRC